MRRERKDHGNRRSYAPQTIYIPKIGHIFFYFKVRLVYKQEYSDGILLALHY